MKKTVINISIFITFLLIYYLQANLFTTFNIAGVMPNLFVILVLFIGLYMSKLMGVAYGIIFGLLLDLIIGKKVGVSAIMLGTIGFLGEMFDKNFSKESRMTIMIMVLISTIIYEVGSYVINYFLYSLELEIIPFIKILLIESLFNIMLTIILFPLIQNLGYEIEEEYKGNKILTRYF